MRSTLIKALTIFVVLVAAIAVGGYVYLRRSLPVVDGAIQVTGAGAPIDIVRDADDIPHIFAATKADAFFGLGYVHAQDRLWQMEFQRRIGNGRLSEIFGDATLAEDRFLRTVGFGRAARSAWERLPEDARTQINWYVAGVNAFISTHHGSQLPPEFTLLRFEPEPWRGEDVIAWVKMMAWDLSANYSFELMYHDLAARVGPERMAELLPPYPANGLNILDGSGLVVRGAGWSGSAGGSGSTGGSGSAGGSGSKDPHYEYRRAEHPASAQPPPNWSATFANALGDPRSAVRNFLLGNRTEALGSNNWVVDGTLTASGKPLLANDPHLATHIPSLWYLAHLTAGDFDVIGATLPGTPAVAIGRNRYIAWGETNVAADVEDLFREKADEPARVIKETIVIKGAPPLTIDVRITRHGPIISDAINANTEASKTEPKAPIREPLALKWTALDEEDQTIVAFLHLNEAKNWTDFTAALRDFVVPSQNFVYADVDGHIGYYIPGHIPIRAADGEWTGWIPFEKLPHVFDPASHFIVTANNRPAAPPYAYFIASEYPNPYRAERITSLIQQKTKITPDDFRAIQADTFSGHAQELLPRLLEHVHPTDAADTTATELLRHWNLDARADSAPAAIFSAWFLRLAPTIAGDELGDYALDSYRGRFSFITRFVLNLLDGSGNQAWCDDVSTPAHETCDAEITRALHEGVATLAKQLGTDEAHWRWDGAHRAVFPHQGLDSVPVLHTLLSRSIPNGGDWSTVNVGPVDVDHPYDQISIPGYRQIIDLSPANDSRFLDAVGESGHFLSPHYDDFLRSWQAVTYKKMRMARADAENRAVGHLRLEPK